MAGFKKNKRGEKKAEGWPPCERKPWTDDMVMKPAGGTGRVTYDGRSYLAEKLRWESSNDPSIFHEPRQVTRMFKTGEGFTAAGKHYASLNELREKRVPEEWNWYEDIFGREVRTWRNESIRRLMSTILCMITAAAVGTLSGRTTN